MKTEIPLHRFFEQNASSQRLKAHKIQRDREKRLAWKNLIVFVSLQPSTATAYLNTLINLLTEIKL